MHEIETGEWIDLADYRRESVDVFGEGFDEEGSEKQLNRVLETNDCGGPVYDGAVVVRKRDFSPGSGGVSSFPFDGIQDLIQTPFVRQTLRTDALGNKMNFLNSNKIRILYIAFDMDSNTERD